MPSPFHEGMVRQLLEMGRAKDIQILVQATGDIDVVCDMSWA